MAAGDISTPPVILASGWEMEVVVDGLSTGGTYNYGLGANNDPATGTPTVVLTVVSMSYDDVGVPSLLTRNVYGVVTERKVYPNANVANESGSNPVTIRVVLSDYVYDSDDSSGGTGGNSGVAPTISIAANWYTQGGTPNNAYSGAVTNNSALPYPRVVGNWSEPGFSKLGNTQTLRCCVFHSSGQIGRPVRCVKFISADTHGNTASVFTTNPAVDASYGDAVPVDEYMGTLDVSGFTQNDIVTSNLIAYPWIGNGFSVLDTAGTTTNSVAGTAQVTPYYGPIKFVCDKNQNYSQGYAVVDATNGVDASGVVSSTLATAFANPYLTIGGAVNGCRTYNNLGSNNGGTTRNNSGGSTIYLRDNAGGVNTFVWTGVAMAGSPSTADAWLTIAGYPGHTRSNLVISGFSVSHTAGLRVKISGVKISGGDAAGLIVGGAGAVLWIDGCEINNTTGSPTIYTNQVVYVSRCDATNLNQGFKPFATELTTFSIVRGNTVSPSETSFGSINAFMFLGNLKTSVTSHAAINDTVAGSQLVPTNTVWAFNRWTQGGASNAMMAARQLTAETHGMAIVQNLLEQTSGASPVLQVAADGSTATAPINNIIMWHNITTGQRLNFAYSENGAYAANRIGWSMKNNIWDQSNIKTDTFSGNSVTTMGRSGTAPTVTVQITQAGHQYQTGDSVYVVGTTPSGYDGIYTVTVSDSSNFTYVVATDFGAITVKPAIAPNPLRIGNWPANYQVGCSGNVFAEIVGVGVPGSFRTNFAGLKSLGPTISQAATGAPTSSTNLLGYIQYVNRASFSGSSGTGNGNYQTLDTSPVRNLVRDWLLSRDITGKVRGPLDTPGVHTTFVPDIKRKRRVTSSILRRPHRR